MKFQAPRGTHDILPEEATLWRYLETQFHQLVSQYGYGEIRTPAFEETELFTRTSGDTSDIVTKQMYQFIDKGGRDITLKPEGTAPAVRAYLEHHLGAQGAATRLWYQTPVFRYERPQKGRFRQHHQFGLECLGSASPLVDAEVIEIAVKFYQKLGLPDVMVSINSIGRSETRERYREAILAHAKSYLEDLDEQERARAERNPLRLLDSKDPKAVDLMQSAPSILDHLEDTSTAHFAELQSALSSAGIPFEIKPQIVRGLDYYTDTVFEVHSTGLGAQSALCGGGRYDGLVKAIGGPDTPAIGFGMGIERLVIVLESHNLIPAQPKPDAFVVAATESARAEVQSHVRQLRSAGFSAQSDLDQRNLKAQFKQADRCAARFAVIIGDDEIAASLVTLRNLTTGEQRSLTCEEMMEAIKIEAPL